DLTPEELAWRPGPEANPMGWILWHMLRVEDMWVQFFAQRQLELWERDGWHEKFGLPTRDNGFGHTTQQVAGFPALDLNNLLEYGEAVRAGTLEYLRGLGLEDFQVMPRADRLDVWWHAVSVGAMFRQIVGELYQHLGQLAYLKGVQRGAGTFPPYFATLR
ncbi:MAG TPA: DinB family protein, partial [Dehalococcoidia bacterium]|nr:DinB family protein [Dehalococcoidia bacterium]